MESSYPSILPLAHEERRLAARGGRLHLQEVPRPLPGPCLPAQEAAVDEAVRERALGVAIDQVGRLSPRTGGQRAVLRVRGHVAADVALPIGAGEAGETARLGEMGQQLKYLWAYTLAGEHGSGERGGGGRGGCTYIELAGRSDLAVAFHLG